MGGFGRVEVVWRSVEARKRVRGEGIIEALGLGGLGWELGRGAVARETQSSRGAVVCFSGRVEEERRGRRPRRRRVEEIGRAHV